MDTKTNALHIDASTVREIEVSEVRLETNLDATSRPPPGVRSDVLDSRRPPPGVVRDDLFDNRRPPPGAR